MRHQRDPERESRRAALTMRATASGLLGVGYVLRNIVDHAADTPALA
jgi:hypothetical protein